jgi:hypothetical protein
MRISLPLLLLIIALPGCKERGVTPASSSFIHSVVDSLPLDKSKNILIYTINPNDCISCINGFKFMNSDLSSTGNGRLFAISVGRRIEKEELSKKITDIDLSDEKNKCVLWGKDLFDGINAAGGITLALSSVMIYNYEKDSVIFSKPIREVSDDQLLRDALVKKL